MKRAYLVEMTIFASYVRQLLLLGFLVSLFVCCGMQAIIAAPAILTCMCFMTGAMGADILDGKKKPADMPIQSQKAEKVLVNLKTAETMGIQIPEDILKTAETVK